MQIMHFLMILIFWQIFPATLFRPAKMLGFFIREEILAIEVGGRSGRWSHDRSSIRPHPGAGMDCLLGVGAADRCGETNCRIAALPRVETGAGERFSGCNHLETAEWIFIRMTGR